MDFSADSGILLMDSPHSVSVGGLSARAIYDAPFKMAGAYEGQMENIAPSCSMLDSDLSRLGIVHGTEIAVFKDTAAGLVPVGTFTVIGLEPDSLGLTRLILTVSE
jgi:Fe2+ transport system protein FeoA